MKNTLEKYICKEYVRTKMNRAVCPCGLSNIDSNCYFNALIQCLLSCLYLNECVMDMEIDLDQRNYVLCGYKTLVHDALKNKPITQMGYRLLTLLRMHIKSNNEYEWFQKPGTQYDFIDGFMILMHAFNNSNRTSTTGHAKRIIDLFTYKSTDTIYCNKCKAAVSKQTRVETILELTELERSKGNSSGPVDYTCPSCNDSSHIVMQTAILVNEPCILVLVINGQRNLMVPSRIILETGTEYNPVSQVDHMGSINSGHYVCICKRKDQWYLFDDMTIHESKFHPNKNTCVVFYERSNDQ